MDERGMASAPADEGDTLETTGVAVSDAATPAVAEPFPAALYPHIRTRLFLDRGLVLRHRPVVQYFEHYAGLARRKVS